MLAEHGGAGEDAIFFVGEADGIGVDGDLEVGVGGLSNVLVVVFEVVVDFHHVAEVFDGAGGDTGVLQEFGDLPAVARVGPFDNQRVELILVGFALLVGCEARVGGEIGAADCGCEGGPLIVAVDGDGDPAVVGVVVGLGWVDAVRAEVEVAVAGAFGHLVFAGVAHPFCAGEGDGGGELGKFDFASAAGAFAGAEGGEHADGEQVGRGEIGVGDADAARLAAGEAHQEVQTGGGHQEVAEGGQLAPGAVAADAGQVQQYQAGVALAQLRVGQAHTLHRAGAVVIDDDIGGRGEVAEEFFTALGAEVEGDGFLVCVGVVEEVGQVDVEASAGNGLVADGVDAGHRFDFDHFGAEVGEDASAERAGGDPSEIEHADAGQRLERQRLGGGGLRAVIVRRRCGRR